MTKAVSLARSVSDTGLLLDGDLAAIAALSGTTGLLKKNAANIWSLDTSTYATQTYVGTQIANLVNSAPAALDTLNELAAALGNDASFATTVTTSLAAKAAKSDTTFIGTTSIALNRTSANLALSGITSIGLPGSTSGTVTLQPAATAGTTTITLPATTGTLITTGDTGTVTTTMIQNGSKLATKGKSIAMAIVFGG
jgi:hypothetical protein